MFEFDTLDSISKKYGTDFTMEKNDGFEKEIVSIFNGSLYHGDIGVLLNAQALYYYYNNDIINAKKYFLMGIDKNNTNSMFNYAMFFENDVSRKNELIKKSVDNGNYAEKVLEYVKGLN